MEILVKLHGALRQYRPSLAPQYGPFPLEVDEGITVGQVLEILGVPKAWLRRTFINERLAEKDQALQPGDRLDAFPPAAGG